MIALRSCFCLLGLLFWSTAFPADKDGNFTVLGHGNQSCGAVVEAYKKDWMGKLINSVWVSGYLTALNVESFQGANIAQHTDPAARDLWIFNYCTAHPLGNLRKATSLLARELR